MAEIFSDTFTEASSDTSLVSHSPTGGVGSWGLLWQAGASSFLEAKAATDNAVPDSSVNNGGVIYTADVTYPSADYEIQATVTLAVSPRPTYLMVRVQDQENMYAVRMTSSASDSRLYKKVSGTWTALGTAVTIASGSVVKLQIIGTTLKLFDDSSEVDSVTVTDISAAGKAGIGMGGGGELVTSSDDINTGSAIDDLTVNDLGQETLVAGAGSLNFTGVATGLVVSRKLTAEAGARTLTGFAAGLLRGYPITAEAGSLTLTGFAANLVVTRKLTAEAGSLTLTGSATGLVAGRKLTAEAGSLTLTGQDADLTYTPSGGYSLTAAAGSLDLSGSPAGLTISRTLTSAAGALGFEGEIARLFFHRRLLAEAGSLSLTGDSAGLTVGRSLIAGAGTLVFTGSAAGLTRAAVMQAAAGALNLAGFAASFTVLIVVIHEYTGDVYANIMPDAGLWAARSPADELFANLTPAEEVYVE